MLLNITTGDETFRSGTAKFHVFLLHTPTVPTPQRKETHLGVIASQGLLPGVQRVANPQAIPAGNGLADMGKWLSSVIEIPEGAILKLWGQRNPSASAMSADRGARMTSAVLIRMRSTAALRRVTFRRITDPLASPAVVKVEGRFDLITTREAFGAGAVIPITSQTQIASPINPRMFTVTEIDGEIATRSDLRTEKITNERGEVVEVKTARPRRALDLG